MIMDMTPHEKVEERYVKGYEIRSGVFAYYQRDGKESTSGISMLPIIVKEFKEKARLENLPDVLTVFGDNIVSCDYSNGLHVELNVEI